MGAGGYLPGDDWKFRTILDSSPDAITVVDLDGNILECNHGTVQLHEFADKEELVGTNVWDLIAAEERSKAVDHIKIILQGGQARNVSMTLLTRTGRRFPAEMSVSTTRDATGKPTGFIGITKDISARRATEDALRGKIEDLDRFFEVALDLLCIADTDGNFRQLNSAWERTLGYTRQELMAKRFIEFVHPDDVESTLATLSSLSLQRDVIGFVNRYRCKDGSYRWLEWKSAPKGVLIYAAARDITERREAEEALRNSEARFRALFEQSGEAIFVADPCGNFKQVNARACEQMGYTRDEMLRFNLTDVIHPDDLAAAPIPFAELQAGEIVAIERRLIRKDGTIIQTESTSKALSDGTIFGIARDITERRRYEERLQTQARMLDAVQQTVVAVDARGIITYWNEFAERLTGWSKDEAIGHPPDSILKVIDLESLRPEIEDCTRQNKSWTGEVTVVDRTGQSIPMLTTVSAVFDDGVYAGSITVAIDITEQKQVEQALRQSEERYGSIFKDSATPLLEIDASRVKMYLDRLQANGVDDLRVHLEYHPETVNECLTLLSLTDANEESLLLFRARDLQELKKQLPATLTEDSMPAFTNSLIMVAEGTTRFEGEMPILTLRGERRYLAIGLSVVPSRQETLDRVLISIVDITERRRAEEALYRQATFDAFMTNLLARFACARGSEIDGLIGDCLEEVGIIFGVDSVFVILIADDIHSWSAVYSWRPRGETSYRQKYQNIPMGTHPWGERMVLTGNIVRIASLDEMPPEAEIERRESEKEGVRSYLSVPLRGRGGHIHGCVGLRSHARRIDWTDEEVGRLSMVADTIANVLERKRAEEALRLSEEKFAKAFESSPDAVVLSELSTSIFLEVNAGFERLSEFTRAEAVGRSALELGVWGVPRERAEIAARLRKNGHVRDMEVHMMSKTKKPLDCLLSAEVIEYGGKLHMLAILRDIREQKEAMEALRLSEEKYAKAFDSSPDAVIISRMDDGRLMEVNAGFEGIFGYTRRQAIGRTVSELGLWVDLEQRSKVVQQLLTGGRVRNLEVALLNKAGQILDSLLSAEVIDIDGQSCMLTTLRDISELKQAQVELAQTKALLSAAIDQSTAGILIARASDNKIVIANDAAVKIRGARMDELIGMAIEHRPQYWQIHKSDGVMFRPEELPLSLAILHGTRTENLEAVIKRTDGTDRWILINAAPIVDPAGKVVAGVAVFADVTDIKRVEMMLEMLVQGTSAGADRQFFDSLVRGMAQGMGCRFAYFAEVDRSNGERVKTTAFWNGKKIDRNFEFAASGIAGEVLTSGKTVIYSKGLAGAYPEDVHARRLGADSFIGTPVFGASGEPLGFLAVSDDKPIPEEIVPQVQSVMTIAAARAGAEIERQRAYEELQVANGRLLDEHKAMMEKNIALQTILDHLERERMEYRRDICTSIDHALTPAIKKLRGREGIAGSRDLAALEDALDSIIGGGIDTFENNYHKLTPREAEICASIAQGRTSKEIADGLHLSVQTVHKHRESIRRKLQVQNLDINLSTFLRHRVR